MMGIVMSGVQANAREEEIQQLLATIAISVRKLAEIEPAWAYRVGAILRAVAEAGTLPPAG
jgi:hypothetical protein